MSRSHDERGDAVTEVVIVMPALLLLIMVVIQFGLWYHAQNVVQTAAQEGARAARVTGATAADGHDRALAFIAQAGGGSVADPDVIAERSVGGVRVEVVAHAPMVVPGLTLGVHAAAASPIEEFTAP